MVCIIAVICMLTTHSTQFKISSIFKKPTLYPTLTQKCIDVLPYKPNNINRAFYYTWYGKVGENINGTSYETGHVFSRHIAVDYRCTDEQKKENKTVFYD